MMIRINLYKLRVDPDRIQPMKSEVIVKKYTKPKKVGSIWLPDQVIEDKTGTVWEVVRSNEKADLEVGATMNVGDILRVRWGHATDLGCEDPADERALYLIPAADIQAVRMNTWSG